MLKFITIFMLLLIPSCCLFTQAPQKVVIDGEIKAHWINKGEIAPFDGVLLSDYTYAKLMQKLDRYEAGK